MIDRRKFLTRTAFAAAGSALPVTTGSLLAQSKKAAKGTASKFFEIQDIKRTTVNLPFRETPARSMNREIPHWVYKEIFEVTLASGQTGIGETTLFYTFESTKDDDVRRVKGKNAIEIMWDDELGAGLQMALFDAAAKTAEVPVHGLLGQKVNETTPLSWWNIDTPAADMASECKLAYESGYLAYKTKGRPWFDVHEQLRQSCAVVPEAFKIDMDFNETLLDAERGLPILRDLEQHAQVDIYESPIPQADIPGNRLICENTRVAVAMHYGNPLASIQLAERICDGFVIGGGASRVMRRGAFAAEAGLPFWLQITGSALTAAWSLHFGGVLSHAVWPAVDCHQLFTEQLLTEPIVVKEGHSIVPSDRPGLGFDLDPDAVAKFQCEKPKGRPEPERLIETAWADGRKMYIANDGTVNFMIRKAMEEKIPFYEEGADTKLVPDDGTPEWRDLYRQARVDPVFQ
ncbi:MAG: mandelate racemase/muconate lactonizing enzyme family protein [Verrucomicrobiales bacterium]|nr:mandelate racemase/muconate lactonizing enzyme family protein [Verrucomicrobiales bacterium]